MTDTIELRLHDAAAAARRTAGTLDRERMLARIEGDRPASRGWALALAGAAVAAAVIGGVAVLGPEVGSPRVDPVATPTGGPTAGPSPEPSPTTELSPEPSPATSPTPGAPTGAGECSADGMSPTPEPQPELPAPVADLRADIAELAVACDLEGLAALGGEDLSFSFGGSEDAAAYWRQGEELAGADDLGPIGALRLVLDTPPGRMEAESAGPSVYWAWPRLQLMTPDSDPAELDAAMDEVVAAGLHTRDELDMMFEQGDGYLGWRVMIELPRDADEASWTAFIAGD